MVENNTQTQPVSNPQLNYDNMNMNTNPAEENPLYVGLVEACGHNKITTTVLITLSIAINLTIHMPFNLTS